MILTHLNYLAVIVATLAYFALGAIWFSPMLFSKPWMAGHGITMPEGDEAKARMRKEMPKMMLVTLILCFIGTLGMGYLETAACTFNWMGGAKIGIVAGGFILIAMALSHMYTKKSFKLTLIDAGYHIVGLIIVGVILAVWR